MERRLTDSDLERLGKATPAAVQRLASRLVYFAAVYGIVEESALHARFRDLPSTYAFVNSFLPVQDRRSFTESEETFEAAILLLRGELAPWPTPIATIIETAQREARRVARAYNPLDHVRSEWEATEAANIAALIADPDGNGTNE